ncbi:MAG: chemotaxis protein [Humidesulfovibrio sp.]|uniref:chemotaxis protein n=1 Tax=Humidesulfovibrio sp. TaxID=2910988 RepID=UPI002737710A|nr:chemotaxis protein [Humidesulfovibrio sp.]MDP2847614.1 chemotaxis protein [Humidesulfovibrio sp.]
MNQTNILLETGTNELEIIELFITERGADGANVNAFFGVNVAKVLEIIEAPEYLEPATSAEHPSYLGVIPLRDMVLPVVDLAVWLGVDRVENHHEPILVTEFNGVRTGFLVSGVTMIHRVSWSDVEPPSRYLSDLPGNCITGTVRLGEHFALLLDLERALVELNALDTTEPEHAPVPATDSPLRVLLVDDSTSVRFLLRRNFEGAGFTVDVKNNGEDAWNHLLALKAEAAKTNTPLTQLLDAVVSDVEMPRMDGYTLTKNIKTDKDLSALPVILFSSLISQGLLHKGQSVGADAQITKPEFGGLTNQVREMILERRAR